MKRLAVIAALSLSGLAALSVPVAAQDGPPSDTVNLVIVYGDDKCEAAADASVINVCVRMEENERYRIPPNLRESDSPANKSWASRVTGFETVGAFGTNSCSASGFGGWSGCTQQLIDRAYEEKRTGPGVRAAQLIQEAREDRLSTIDADAAAEQARVEEFEKEYDAKKKAEEEAATKAGQ